MGDFVLDLVCSSIQGFRVMNVITGFYAILHVHMANTTLKGQIFGQKLPPLYKLIEDVLKDYPSG